MGLIGQMGGAGLRASALTLFQREGELKLASRGQSCAAGELAGGMGLMGRMGLMGQMGEEWETGAGKLEEDGFFDYFYYLCG